jgi:hypothetical protein
MWVELVFVLKGNFFTFCNFKSLKVVEQSNKNLICSSYCMLIKPKYVLQYLRLFQESLMCKSFLKIEVFNKNTKNVKLVGQST